MAYYEELEDLINYATSKLLSNENICKLVHYYSDVVDYRYDPLEQPSLPSEIQSTLLLDRIYPLPKTPDPETEQVCLVTVGIGAGSRLVSNIGYRKTMLVFDVICHLDSWLVKGGYRPLKIVHEIDKMFNNIAIENISIDTLKSHPLISRDYSYKFYGYQLAYELTVNSNISCG